MNRRSAALTGALALSLLASPAAAHAAAPTAPTAPASGRVSTSPSPDPAATALKHLRADADGSVVVHRDSEGDVSSVSSAHGGGFLDSGASTATAATKKLFSAYGDAFGIDGDNSTAQVTQSIPSATGTIVRTQQVVDGVPVFGGQVVVSVDKDQDVSSVTSATTDPDQSVPAPVVSQATARATALGLTARDQKVSAGTLSVTDVGRRLYDPTVVGATDPFGTQPVWQFTVSNGSNVQETVLVSTARGSVVAAFDDAPEAANRKICDNGGGRSSVPDTGAVPTACASVRSEGAPAVTTGSGATDINDAYDNLGHVSDAYAALDGIDLTNLIGLSVNGVRTLQGTVRWCYAQNPPNEDPEPCPYDNAFWDGDQMVFGAGYAGALDVVGHEMTHGYVDRTSQLFYFHEAGSINESVADTIGEIVDHRNGGANDGWNLGEDLPGGTLRNMANPTVFGQPDTTQSSLYDGSDADDGDYGAVHQNDGVGNKTAYLISHGGSFGGQTVAGIDGSDTGDSKTGRLYLEMIPRLTSGADWVQYGQTLISTCQQLAIAGTGGFTDADCTSVTQAVAATQLLTQPASEAKQVAVSCPTGATQALIARDDDNISTLGLTSTSPLWGTVPDSTAGIPSYAVSGTQSRLGLDPDPSLGDPASGTMTSTTLTLPSTGPAYLNFHHAYELDWVDSTYYDGAQVLVQKLSGSTWQTVTGLPWVNGPNRHIVATGAGFTGFGGDSHGFGSSQVNLSSLHGQKVRFVFQVAGDSQYSSYGWWLDDIRLYSCAGTAPSTPASAVAAASATSARVTWVAPAFTGATPITGYRITASNGRAWTTAPTARSLTVGGLNPNAPVSFRVVARSAGGTSPVSGTPVINATASSLASSAAKVKKKKAFRLTATVVRRGTRTRAAAVPVVLQKKVGSAWRALSSGTTSSAGTKVWVVKQKKPTYYRVVTTARRTWWGSTSGARKVAIRR